MVADDERRRVAERLRMSDERDAAGFDCLLANAVRGYYFCKTPCEECHGRLLDELADLIDLNSHTNSGTAEVTTSQVPKFDREALLVLTRELNARATELLRLNDLDRSRRRRAVRLEHAADLMTVSSRIARALGAAANGLPTSRAGGAPAGIDFELLATGDGRPPGADAPEKN